MAEVNISFTGNTDLSQVFVDDVLVLEGTGSGAAKLDGSGEHALSWFVRGAPGSSYRLELTSAGKVLFATGFSIDSSTKDAGIQWFQAPSGGGK